MGFALASSSSTREDILKLRSDMDALGDEISKYSQAAWGSKEFVLNVVMRIKESAQQGSVKPSLEQAGWKVFLLRELQGNRRPPHSPIDSPLPPVSIQTSN